MAVFRVFHIPEFRIVFFLFSYQYIKWSSPFTCARQITSRNSRGSIWKRYEIEIHCLSHVSQECVFFLVFALLLNISYGWHMYQLMRKMNKWRSMMMKLTIESQFISVGICKSGARIWWYICTRCERFMVFGICTTSRKC